MHCHILVLDLTNFTSQQLLVTVQKLKTAYIAQILENKNRGVDTNHTLMETK